MADQTELRNSYNNTQDEISQEQSAYELYCGQIEELRAAKEKLEEIITQTLDASDILDQGYEEWQEYWSGNAFNTLCYTIDEELTFHLHDYYLAQENVIDQLNQKISELETQRDRQDNIIGILKNRLSDLWYDLQN